MLEPTNLKRPPQRNLFSQLIDLLRDKQPLQKKKIEQFMAKQTPQYFQSAETYLDALFSVAREQFGYSPDDLVECYIKFCHMIVKENMYFKRHGSYRAKDQSDNLSLYRDNAFMFSYMCGLGVSQFLWENHYNMWRFFQRMCEQSAATTQSYLEVGPGHGFYFCEAANTLKNANLTCIDLSRSSLDITQKMYGILAKNVGRLDPIHGSFLDLPNNSAFDMVVICEVLEHVNDPRSFLRQAHNILKPGGRVIISTCANSAAIDHIYLYESISHIHSHIKSENFDIVDELALPIENSSTGKEFYEQKIPSNYIAMLQKRPMQTELTKRTAQ